MDNDIKKRHIFSTNCILEAFNLGPGAKKQPHLFGHESADDLKNPHSLKGPSVRRPLGIQRPTGRFDPSLLATKNNNITLNTVTALTSVVDLSAQLPDFPWLIFHRRVLIPDELISRFDLPTLTDSSNVSFVQGEVLELQTELRSVTQFSAIETNNWHRSSLFSILGTIFCTMHDENSVLSESQVALFATTLLSQSFGYLSGTPYSPNKGQQQQPVINQPSATAAKSTTAVTSRTAPKSTLVTKPTVAVKRATMSKTSAASSVKSSTPKSMPTRPTTALKSATAVLNTNTASTCAACGFFLLKTNFAANQEVVSLLPNSKDLCTCLSLLSDLGVFLGSNEVLLPCCVVQYTGTDNEIDLANLAKEMDQIHEMNKLVWQEAPRPYGIVVSGHTWQIQTLVAIDHKKKSVVVWAHDVHSISDALYVAAVIYRFAAYLLDKFKQIQPDFGKLSSLLQLKLRAKPPDMNSEDWAKISDKVHKFMEYIKPSLHAKVSMVPNAVELPQHDIEITESTQDDAIQRFFSELSEDGFEDFKLVYQHATSKVYKAQRENKPLVVKIKHRKFIVHEAKILAALSVHMYKNGLINNSELGYLILEHLHPLPPSVNNAHELQTITRQLMSVCANLTVDNSDCVLQIIAAVHQKNYIHRDIKPGNVMKNKDGSLRLIDFDCAIHKDDTDFDTCYGTHAFKPPELNNTHAPYCWTPKAMIGAKIQGSDKSDSYSAALICAALMYNIELNELQDIEKVKEWLDEDRIEHVATPSAIELFQWMMHPIPELRLTATLAHCHTFLRKYIPVAKTKK